MASQVFFKGVNIMCKSCEGKEIFNCSQNIEICPIVLITLEMIFDKKINNKKDFYYLLKNEPIEILYLALKSAEFCGGYINKDTEIVDLYKSRIENIDSETLCKIYKDDNDITMDIADLFGVLQLNLCRYEVGSFDIRITAVEEYFEYLQKFKNPNSQEYRFGIFCLRIFIKNLIFYYGLKTDPDSRLIRLWNILLDLDNDLLLKMTVGLFGLGVFWI